MCWDVFYGQSALKLQGQTRPEYVGTSPTASSAGDLPPLPCPSRTWATAEESDQAPTPENIGTRISPPSEVVLGMMEPLVP